MPGVVGRWQPACDLKEVVNPSEVLDVGLARSVASGLTKPSYSLLMCLPAGTKQHADTDVDDPPGVATIGEVGENAA